MKNELFKIAFLATTLMAGSFVSCNENELDPDNGQHSGKKISFSISEDKTRTAYDDKDNLQINWTEGDKVRIFCDEAEDVKQADYTVKIDEAQKNTGKLVYNADGLAWGGDTDMHNFYAVYPADDSKVSVDASTGIATFTVNHNQFCTVQGNGAVNNHYSTTPNMKEAYMVANLSTTPVPDVALNFKPIMTTLEITVQGVTTENSRDVTLSGISIINKKATYPGVSEGKFKYDFVKKAMSEEGVENATTETYYVGIRNGSDSWVDLKAGESITLTVFLPPVVINNDNQVTIQVHATGELNAIIGGRTDKNGKETNIAPSAKAKITLPNMPETKSGNNWITPLDDKIYVQQLSIPGTHDAAADNTTLRDAGQTQGFTISQQWHMGIRAFDLRTSYTTATNEMWMYHGVTSADKSLDEVLRTITDSLKRNPGEFAILQFRHETEEPCVSKPKDTSKWDEIYNALYKYDNQIIQWRNDLTIGECRKNLIILTRDDYTDRKKAGLITGFPDCTTGEAKINGTTPYYVQDYYKYGTKLFSDGGAEKRKQITSLYETTYKFSNSESSDFIQKSWALNHTSGYAGLLGTTSQYQLNASYVNKQTYETFCNETKLGPTGIVFMDWVGTRKASSYTVYGDLLPQAIIDHNYKYRMLRAE